MTTGASLNALQWLIFIQENDEKLINNKNERVALEHKFYRGEKRFKGWDIDGFAEVDGNLLFYEFLGCYHHKGCPYCGNAGEKDERFDRKKAELQKFGELIIMRECKWIKQRNKWKSRPTPSFPDVLNVFSNVQKY